jgi:hypothetical protein
MSTTPMFSSDSPTDLNQALRCFVRYNSPRVLIVSFFVTLAARLFFGDWSIGDAVVVVVILGLWPLEEWLIHVFILHSEPIVLFGRKFDFEVPRSHRIHHRDPWNLEILFIPLQGYFLGLPPLLLISFGVLPTYALALTAIAFYLAMTLQYEWWHFLVHTRVKPHYAYHRRLWRNHRLHHCKNERYWYGVSMLMGDRLLSTAPEPGRVETSPTCRTLGLDDTLARQTA